MLTEVYRFPRPHAELPGLVVLSTVMPEVRRYRPEDHQALDSLFRRVFGNDSADAFQLRWFWQYRRNPNNPDGQPMIFVVQDGPAIVGQYGTMPVRLSLRGRDLAAAWGGDFMVAPERQRQGFGEALLRTWDQQVGASLGVGFTVPNYNIFMKLGWPDTGPIPCLVKPLSRRAFRRPTWPPLANRLMSALTLPIVRIAGRSRPIAGAELAPTRRFDESFTTLWEQVAPKFELAVRRDAPYLNWKFIETPHVRQSAVVLRRSGRTAGYAVYRHVYEPRGRVTLLIDFLTDPDDRSGLSALLGWVDREARAADSDKIRTLSTHAAFRRTLRQCGYFHVQSNVNFAVKISAVDVPVGFYKKTEGWHFTHGDGDLNR